MYKSLMSLYLHERWIIWRCLFIDILCFVFCPNNSDLGVHIDGYIAVVAHTVCVGEPIVGGRKADVLAAAYIASECALRMLKPGNTVLF